MYLAGVSSLPCSIRLYQGGCKGSRLSVHNNGGYIGIVEPVPAGFVFWPDADVVDDPCNVAADSLDALVRRIETRYGDADATMDLPL